MSFISLPTGKLHKKTETTKLKIFTLVTWVGFIEIWQIMSILLLVQILMERLPTMLVYLQTMSKSITRQPLIFLKECKMTSTTN